MRSRILVAGVALVSGWTLCAAGAADASTMELKGVIDVPPFGPGGTLVLPLPSSAPPVTVLVSVGSPPVVVPVRIDASTSADTNDGSALILTDGVAVEVYLQAQNDVFRAISIEEDFPDDVLVRGTVEGLTPGASVSLPLPLGGVADFLVRLEGAPSVIVPVRIFSRSHVQFSFVVQNGTLIEVEGLLRNGQILATDVVRR
jgi:hypothetical protein